MVNPLIHKQLEEQLDRLPLEQQRCVLQYALDLAAAFPTGIPGAALLSFTGTIPNDDLATMRMAIEQGCEQP